MAVSVIVSVLLKKCTDILLCCNLCIKVGSKLVKHKCMLRSFLFRIKGVPVSDLGLETGCSR